MSYEGEIMRKFAKQNWLKRGDELTLKRLAVASRGGQEGEKGTAQQSLSTKISFVGG
jgi:hypothetical protein